MSQQTPQQKRSNIRLALILALIALGVFVGFVWTTAGSAQ